MRNTIFARGHSLMLTGLFFLSGAALLVMPIASARATVVQSELENASDPSALYGNCGSSASGLVRKSDEVLPAGGNLSQIGAIYVLNCHGFDGPGGAFIVPCPPVPPGANTPSYCVGNQNDGLGNDIFLGVYLHNTLPCVVTSRRLGPPAQIDIRFWDPAFGIATVEFRGGVVNAQTQPYAVVNDHVPIIVTATKINQSQPASLSNILVTNRARVTTTCNFSF